MREPAARMQCANNLKQMVTALHCYASVHGSDPVTTSTVPLAVQTDVPDARFPAGCFGPGATPEERLSWMVELLPYVEQDAVFRQFDVAKGYAGNLTAARTLVKTFLCPEGKWPETGDAVTNYVAMAGIGHDAATRPAGAPGNGVMGYDRVISLRGIADGTSNTIALMETRTGLGPWARGGTSTVRGFDPADLPLSGEQRPFGAHAKSMQVGMADGTVRSISSSIDPAKLAAAITVAGGETIGLD